MIRKTDILKTGTFILIGVFLLMLGCASKKSESTVADAPSETSEIQNENIGLQIYSARDALSKDFAGTMKKIADMGYKYIEGYGMDTEGKIFGMAPAEYRKVIEENGMELISCHASYFTPEQAPKIIEASKEAGLKYLIIPYLSDELRSDYRKVAQNLNEVGKLFKDTGIKFGYHNHAFEFEKQGDEIPMEILLQETDPELVTFEVDLYWVVKAGHDPMELIKKYPGRFSLYHVKDANQNLDQTTLGTGIIDFKALINAGDEGGLEYYFVEDERTDDPMANLKANYKYISELKLD